MIFGVPQHTFYSSCSLCAPNSWRNGDFFPSRTYIAPLLVSIKGGADSIIIISLFFFLPRPQHTHTHARSPEHDIGTCLNHLAETWELPFLSRLACTPYYRHPRCKIVQCIRTPLCWMYGHAARTRINSCVPVLPLASAIRSEGSRSIVLVGAGPPGQNTESWRAR